VRGHRQSSRATPASGMAAGSRNRASGPLRTVAGRLPKRKGHSGQRVEFKPSRVQNLTALKLPPQSRHFARTAARGDVAARSRRGAGRGALTVSGEADIVAMSKHLLKAGPRQRPGRTFLRAAARFLS